MAVSHSMNPRSFPHQRRHVSFARHLIAGAVGVLAGLQYLLSPKGRIQSGSDTVRPRPAPQQNGPELPEPKRDYFSIRRTKSELGYVYWVLHGHGEFQCFVLYDTWREALDEALRRASEYRGKSVPHLVSAIAV
jgi:hypothetical protein